MRDSGGCIYHGQQTACFVITFSVKPGSLKRCRHFLGIPQALEELQEELEFSGDSLHFTRLEAYSVQDPGNGIENIAAAVRQDYGRVSHLSISDLGKTRDEYRAGQFVPTEIVDQIEAVIGTDYVTAEVGGSYPVAAGADEWVNIHVLYYSGLMATFAIVEVTG
jgi:hypothetical protein